MSMTVTMAIEEYLLFICNTLTWYIFFDLSNKGNILTKKFPKSKQKNNLPELLEIFFVVVISTFWVECGSYIIFDAVISSFLVEWGSEFMLVLFSIQVILICVILKHDLHLPKLYALLGRFISNWNRVMPNLSGSEHDAFCVVMVQILLHSSWVWCHTFRSKIIKNKCVIKIVHWQI